MQTKFRFLALFAILSIFGNRAFSQSSTTYFHKNGPGWWTFGIDGGMAYQSSDVRSTWNGWGGGMTLGKNLAYRPGGLFSFDMRGRLLLDRSFGANHRRSTGLQFNKALNGDRTSYPDYLLDTDAVKDSSFVFANHRTTMFEGGLEGVLTLNRLREKTGVVVNFFGGIGLDWYNAHIDQTDQNGNIYFDKYLTVNQLGTRRDNLAALRGIRDGNFETHADGYGYSFGKFGIMPGAGIEIGFQVTPRFVIGLGHKLTFSRTDILDGQQWTNQNTATAKNDVAHYTNLHLRWDIERRKKRENPPEITITDPGDNPHESLSSNLFVRADIKNVRSAADVTARLNGREIPFRFPNPKFGVSLPLIPGRNELIIRASNLVGDDSKTLIVFYKNPSLPPQIPPTPPPPVPTRLRPEVQFTSPARSPFYSEKSEIFVIAAVKNVNSSRDLRFFVNGTADNRFSFSEGFEASVRLRDGRNTLRLEADNGNGTASDEIEIILETPKTYEKPSVLIEILPQMSNPCGKLVTAKIERVESKSDISVFFNNRETREWSYDSRRGIVTADFELQPGRNQVRVVATNRGGTAQDEKTVECKDTPAPPPVRQKPAVSISEPTNGRKFSVKKITLVGRAENVADRSNIQVTANNQSVRDFDFDKTNGEIRADIELTAGENTLKISATNSAGPDEATVRVTFSGIKTPPVVSIVSPKNGFSTDKNRAEIEATITNVTANSGVDFLVNGISGTRFSFSNGKLTATASLRDGENTITVRGTNADGTDEESIKIRLETTKKPPVVTFVSPKNGAETDKNEASIEANITNLTSSAGAFLTVNGSKVARFQFADGKLKGIVSLREGENTVAVRGTNDDGSDEKSIRITYKKATAEPSAPVQLSEPTVRFTYPSRANQTTTNSVEILKFSTQNVENAAQIKVTAGRSAPLAGLNFDPKTGTGSIQVKLSKGENNFKIVVTTAGGTATAGTKLSYAPPKSGPLGAKPTVTIISATDPVTSPTAPNEARSTIIAKITEIATRDGVKMTVNGTAIDNFTYDEKKGDFRALIQLVKGENKVVIRAENENGSAETERIVKF